MKIISVFGTTRTGKTTTIEQIIRELRKRRYSVGSIKEIHNEAFALDREGSNTARHRAAGAQLVTARGLWETDILYQDKRPIREILKHYNHDFVICEGVTDINAPKIITGRSADDLENRWQTGIFACAGPVAGSLNHYRGLPVYNALSQASDLVDLIEQKALPLLPDVDPACCRACGTDCRDFCAGVLDGRLKLADCIQFASPVQVYLNDQPLDMVPFVQDMLQAAICGMLGQLRGYQKNADIRIELKGERDARL